MRLTIALFILTPIFSKRTNADYVQPSCAEKSRKFIATEGHALIGHVISTHSVNLLPDCHDLCLQAPRCLSYNYEYKSMSSSHVCEINDATENMCPGSLVRKPGFKYYEEKDSMCTRPCPASTIDTDETSFQVTFPERSVTDYIRLDLQRSVPRLTAFTVCWWLRTADRAAVGTSISYAVPGISNDIVIMHVYDTTKHKIHIGSVKRTTEKTDVINDDKWHHICTTWENAAGSWNMYIDGTPSANDDDFKTGHVIDNNGILILGQKQDIYGGGFESSQSFSGQMYGVNMWNKALTAKEILHMSANCSYGVGNYLKWSDFVTGLHGKVYKTSPATCLP